MIGGHGRLQVVVVCVCESEREREGGGSLTGVKHLGGLGLV